MRSTLARAVAALSLTVALAGPAAAATPAEMARWRAEAARVTIVRDDWGIAHVHGRTDADAVFGMIYAQAEDDFHRVETNYLTSLGLHRRGRRASPRSGRTCASGSCSTPPTCRPSTAPAPAWLQRPDERLGRRPQLLPRHPSRGAPRASSPISNPGWRSAFTEGSIGGDIERVDLKALEAFYRRARGRPPPPRQPRWPWPRRSPPRPVLACRAPTASPSRPKNTIDHHALLLINPHTSFFFRSELQMSSDQGLDAYGAVTWGQFFIYQGFNPHIGWMHTSSGVDNVDEFAETIDRPRTAAISPTATAPSCGR